MLSFNYWEEGNGLRGPGKGQGNGGREEGRDRAAPGAKGRKAQNRAGFLVQLPHSLAVWPYTHCLGFEGPVFHPSKGREWGVRTPETLSNLQSRSPVNGWPPVPCRA